MTTPGGGDILIRVSVCGVCHTELDEVEGRGACRHPDGAVNLVWPGESEMHGVIAEIDPPRRLRYSWFERDYTSQLSFDVAGVVADQSQLTLTHRDASEEDAPGFGAGWHSHLESLAAMLSGEGTSKASRDARYEELRPTYDDLLAAT